MTDGPIYNGWSETPAENQKRMERLKAKAMAERHKEALGREYTEVTILFERHLTGDELYSIFRFFWGFGVCGTVTVRYPTEEELVAEVEE